MWVVVAAALALLIGRSIRLADRRSPGTGVGLSTADLPTKTENAPIVGESVTLTLDGLRKRREQEVAFAIARLVVEKYFPAGDATANLGESAAGNASMIQLTVSTSRSMSYFRWLRRRRAAWSRKVHDRSYSPRSSSSFASAYLT